MILQKEEAEHFSKSPFKLLNAKTLIHDNSIVGYDISVVLKDEKSVDDFAEWYKKELLKLNG